MNKSGKDINLAVNGYEVSASFSDNKNTTAVRHIKQILLSSFSSHLPKNLSDESLAMSSGMKDNNGEGNARGP